MRSRSHLRALLSATLTAVVASGLALGLVPADAGRAVQAVRATPGSAGSGDSLLPRMGNGGYDVRDYDIDLTWTPRTREISARTTIRAVARQHLSRFNLDLNGLTVRAVSVNGTAAGVVRRGTELTVRPRFALARGRAFTTVVRYDGRPRTLRSKQLGRTGWLMTDDGATALSEPIGSETWYPVNNTLRDKATYSISVSVPRGLTAASNGRLLRRQQLAGPTGPRTVWHWREDSPMAPFLSTVSIGRYSMYRSTMAGRRPVLTFVDPRLGRQVAGRRVLPQVVSFLERRFGRYPFTSAGLIVDRMNIGYALETQGRPVLPGSAPDYLVMHEMAHQWFGNSVTPADWRHIWLSEGVATYTEWMWDAHRSGKPGLPRSQFDFLYDIYGRKATFWDVPPGDPGSVDRLFAGPVYERGAMTIHALRMRVGERAFFTTLRRWAQQNRHGLVTTADFVRTAERASGQQLDRFFRVWLFTPAKPAGY